MSDRIAGLIILALTIWFGWTAGSYEASFGDPLGPAAFPQMLAVPAALLSLVLIFKPDPNPEWVMGRPAVKQLATLAVLIAYALLLEELGFVLSTALGVIAMGRLLGAGWARSVASGIVMSVTLFFVFDRLLGLPLPLYPAFVS
jgi:putative tricarboxylic transport membrane protein